ncbi:MAG: hypothetical protein JWO31_4319 [Phycisphaerales bacterium]|nr:hypothetical protein [Phycisphaerales bacterium]
MQQARFRPAVEFARGVLLARPPVPRDVWGPDPARRELAYFLCQTLARELNWPNARFVPGDPMSTLCNLGGVLTPGRAVALAVGDRLDRRMTTAEWSNIETLTLGGAIDALLPLAGRRCTECDYVLDGNVTGTCPECGSPTGA